MNYQNNTLENARKYVRSHLQDVSWASGKGLTRHYIQAHTAATRSLQTILLRSKAGWEKARAEHMLFKLVDISSDRMDYEIDFEPHLPKEWT